MENQAKTTETTTQPKATKTCGVFKVTSSANPEFEYMGSSTQIEIVFKNYKLWAKKGKAPKAIQEEVDKNGVDSLQLEIVESCSPSKLKELRAKYIAPPTPPAAKPAEADAPTEEQQ